MAIDIQKGLSRVTDVARYLPTPQDLLRPFPRPNQGELVTAGIAADILSYGLGFIPWVGDIRLTPGERVEFREQNRVYPNGIALVRTFQRTQVAPGGGSR